MRHIVLFSGGASSFAAAQRVAERYGTDDTVLLSADTMSEADGWSEWIAAAAEVLDCESVMLRDGRDIWQLADDMNMIPSSRAGFCTRVLKQQQIDRWQQEHCPPDSTTLYFGFDFTRVEQKRLERMRGLKAPYRVEAPLMWSPVAFPGDAEQAVIDAGLPLPDAYKLGLPHNNCLKYGCVKGGIKYWRQLLHAMPESFARSEERENALRERLGDFSILTDRVARDNPDAEELSDDEWHSQSVVIRRPLPLSELRRREEAGQPPTGDWGECGCLTLF